MELSRHFNCCPAIIDRIYIKSLPLKIIGNKLKYILLIINDQDRFFLGIHSGMYSFTAAKLPRKVEINVKPVLYI